MDLGPYLAFDGVNYICTICERTFSSETALYAHCRSTSRHSWCERCSRVFISLQARNSHLQGSKKHYICPKCPHVQDFKAFQELQDHLVESHYFCPDCKLYYSSFDKLQEHDIARHHLCITCGDYFANKNNLQMHQQKHQPRTMECYGCYRCFKTISGVLIHLESGSCVSEVTEEELDDIARECYQSGKYIYTGFEGGEWLYRCPSCDYTFAKLSALYQHAEDVLLCSSLLSGDGCLAKLARFIARSLQ
ncbi:hypothetical protein BJY01DRAFT_120863 [Aspergillus pseudoustus]|uniref:C2H2-type domain-containing protein n=1 Tax=Aspergillus pseudoustus TaxID=1810923 RepID=A0ABR4IQV5_9EURO